MAKLTRASQHDVVNIVCKMISRKIMVFQPCFIVFYYAFCVVVCSSFNLRKGSLRDASASAVALKKHLCEAWSDQRLDVFFEVLRLSDLTQLWYFPSFQRTTIQRMVNCWFGLVIWIPGIPL